MSVGKGKGSASARRLADLTIHPPTDAYEQVPPEECEEIPVQLVLADGHEILGRFVLWRDQHMVEFALMQMTRYEGKWVEVARIDTCHQKIHKHLLSRGSPDRQGVVTEIEQIPPNDPWIVIDQGYTNALTIMETEWQENLRRWRGATQ